MFTIIETISLQKKMAKETKGKIRTCLLRVWLRKSLWIEKLLRL